MISDRIQNLFVFNPKTMLCKIGPCILMHNGRRNIIRRRKIFEKRGVKRNILSAVMKRRSEQRLPFRNPSRGCPLYRHARNPITVLPARFFLKRKRRQDGRVRIQASFPNITQHSDIHFRWYFPECEVDTQKTGRNCPSHKRYIHKIFMKALKKTFMQGGRHPISPSASNERRMLQDVVRIFPCKEVFKHILSDKEKKLRVGIYFSKMATGEIGITFALFENFKIAHFYPRKRRKRNATHRKAIFSRSNCPPLFMRSDSRRQNNYLIQSERISCRPNIMYMFNVNGVK